MLVYDGPMHVGQLQFRPYIPDTMSPDGLHDPLYWMDFSGNAPPLPDRTLALFCYHVGQRDNTSSRDSRYFGRGIGVRLLEKTLEWARRLAKGPVKSMGIAKRTFYEAFLMNSDQALDMEARRQARLMTQPDFVNAVLAFHQKKEPTFS